jgi:hypothetical protein
LIDEATHPPGLGRTRLGEQGERLPPVELSRFGSRSGHEVAEEEQDLGLMEALAGVAVDGEGLPRVLCGLLGLPTADVEVGERGEGLAPRLVEAVAAAAPKPASLARASASASHPAARSSWPDS